MKKLYINDFNNRALLIDESARSYSLISAETARTIRFKTWRDGLRYPAKLERIGELLRQLKARGFKRF